MGLEPMTSALRARHTTYCATPPLELYICRHLHE